MSELLGKGYGDSHDWKNNGVFLDGKNRYFRKYSLWNCLACGLAFKHFYDARGHVNIHDALKKSGIPNTCSQAVTGIK